MNKYLVVYTRPTLSSAAPAGERTTVSFHKDVESAKLEAARLTEGVGRTPEQRVLVCELLGVAEVKTVFTFPEADK
jgi:hypothetical protein